MTTFNIRAFANQVRDRRGNMPLRDLEEILGISASTLSRIENGKIPDLEDYLKLCDWYHMRPFNESHLLDYDNLLDRETKTIEKIEALLLADGNVHEDIIQAIMILVRHAYKSHAKSE